ncbi:MAG: 30S ribosomal protein S7 [Candidatus Margulisbacteria bacterium]|nr:30S ribosomal protein S7 [Candidatus Margulisiibacteriota bacterium]
MPRRGNVPKRKIEDDPIFGSVTLHKFVNKIMYDGKKSKAEKIIYSALEIVGQKLNKDPLEVFVKALDNVTPLLEVKARRVGGATYQVPLEVTRARGQAIGMQWLREAARERKGHSMIENLSAEIIDACGGTGGAMKKKEDLHKTAEANKAFAHFRW